MNPGTDWAEQVPRLVESLRGVIGGLADKDAGTDADGSSATGTAAECRWCPLCQLIAALRGERPELAEVLADVLRATADALHTVAATSDGSRPAGAPAHEEPVQNPPPAVQRIDIA